jgi:hypothetical protein
MFARRNPLPSSSPRDRASEKDASPEEHREGGSLQPLKSPPCHTKHPAKDAHPERAQRRRIPLPLSLRAPPPLAFVAPAASTVRALPAIQSA